MRLFSNNNTGAAKAPTRQYENYVGSRFLFRLSNELQSVKYKFSTRFSRAVPPRNNHQVSSTSNPLYHNNKNGEPPAAPADANIGRPRPVIPSALVQLAVPGYDDQKTPQSGTYTGRKFACILIVIVIFLSVVVGIAASSRGQAKSNQENAFGNSTAPTVPPPTNNDEGAATFRPSVSPSNVIVTKGPSSTPTRKPSASPTVATKGKTEPPSRERDDRRRLARQQNRRQRKVAKYS